MTQGCLGGSSSHSWGVQVLRIVEMKWFQILKLAYLRLAWFPSKSFELIVGFLHVGPTRTLAFSPGFSLRLAMVWWDENHMVWWVYEMMGKLPGKLRSDNMTWWKLPKNKNKPQNEGTTSVFFFLGGGTVFRLKNSPFHNGEKSSRGVRKHHLVSASAEPCRPGGCFFFFGYAEQTLTTKGCQVLQGGPKKQGLL